MISLRRTLCLGKLLAITFWASTAMAAPPASTGSSASAAAKAKAASGEDSTREVASRLTRRPSAARNHRLSSNNRRSVPARMAGQASIMRRRYVQEEPALDQMPLYQDGEVLEGPLMMDGMYSDGLSAPMPFDSGDCGGCDGGCGSSACDSCCLIPCSLFSLNNLELFAGSHGFTGPLNRGETASFGFQQGINVGVPMSCLFGGALAGQLGFQAAQSNFSEADFSDDTRNQVFVTGGLFRRVDWGLQGGLVIDFLHDDWYYELDLVQLRGELSWMYPSGHELGFWFTASEQDDISQSILFDDNGVRSTITESWQSTDLFAFYYRHQFKACPGAEARFYAGFSDDNDGLVGSDIRLPLTDSFVIESGYTYLIPEDGANAHEEESWNLAFNLVWYPGCQSRGDSYSRPLFRVANNGSFMVDRVR